MNIDDEFLGVVQALTTARIDFAVCGGVAMALHGFPRFTTDIDVLIDDADVERAVEAVKACGFDFDAGDMMFPDMTVHRVNKIVGSDFIVLDLLITNSPLAEVWDQRVRVEWRGQSIPVVSAAGLARMKLIAGRPQDMIDIQRMGFSPDDPAIQP